MLGQWETQPLKIQSHAVSFFVNMIFVFHSIGYFFMFSTETESFCRYK